MARTIAINYVLGYLCMFVCTFSLRYRAVLVIGDQLVHSYTLCFDGYKTNDFFPLP